MQASSAERNTSVGGDADRGLSRTESRPGDAVAGLSRAESRPGDEVAELGSTSVSRLMAALEQRVREVLGARDGDAAVRIEDGAAVTALVDRFARELAALADGARAEGSGPSIEDLGWEDDLQTLEQAAPLAHEPMPTGGPPRQSVVLGTLRKGAPGSPHRRGPWAPSDSEPPPSEDHLPLLGGGRHADHEDPAPPTPRR